MIYWPFDSMVSDDGNGNLSYDRAFDSASLRKIFKMLYTNGVAMTDDSTALQVIPGTGMNVTVRKGMTVIEGAMGYQEDSESITLTGSSVTYGRIDTIVARLNTNISGRSVTIECIKGTEAAVPAAPAIVRSGGIYDLRLANIRIPAGTSVITAAMITDTRLGTECGVATARPQKVDTSAIHDQYQASLEEYLEYVQDCISGTVAGNLQAQISEMQDPTDEESLAGQIVALTNSVNRLTEAITRANKLITELSAHRNVMDKGFSFNNKNWNLTSVYCVGRIVFVRGYVNGSWNTGSTLKWSQDDKNTVHFTAPKGYAPVTNAEIFFGAQTASQNNANLRFEIGNTVKVTNEDESTKHLVYGFAATLRSGYQYRFQAIYIRNGSVEDVI